MPLPGQERVGKQGQLAAYWWLKDKARHDQVDGGLWRVHDKIYDLTPFLDSHPGGAHWLSRTQGQDITDYYETHHIDTDKTNAILAKYFVADQKNHPPTGFEFSSNNLYGRIKQKVREALKHEKLT